MQVLNGYTPAITPEHYQALYWIPAVSLVHNYSLFIKKCCVFYSYQKFPTEQDENFSLSMILEICVVYSFTVHKAPVMKPLRLLVSFQ